MKLLFITKNHEHYIEKSSYYLQQELLKHCDLMIWDQDGSIPSIIEKLPFHPDFILVNDLKPDYSPNISGLNEVCIPSGIIMHDLHYKIYLRKQFIRKEQIQTIFSVYREAFHRWFPEFTDRMIWLPHHVDTNVFTDYGLTKHRSYLVTGYLNAQLYPLRSKMHEAMCGEKDFASHPHPGYRNIVGEAGWCLGEDYAKEINASKILLTCNSVYHFPLLKYYEAAACNTLLLAPSSEEIKDLGFVDEENFVAVTEHNFKEKAEHYFREKETRERIARQGYEMVRERHSTKVRVQQLLTHIEEIVRRSNV